MGSISNPVHAPDYHFLIHLNPTREVLVITRLLVHLEGFRPNLVAPLSEDLAPYSHQSAHSSSPSEAVLSWASTASEGHTEIIGVAWYLRGPQSKQIPTMSSTPLSTRIVQIWCVVNDRLATPPAKAGGMSASLRSAGGSPPVYILGLHRLKAVKCPRISMDITGCSRRTRSSNLRSIISCTMIIIMIMQQFKLFRGATKSGGFVFQGLEVRPSDNEAAPRHRYTCHLIPPRPCQKWYLPPKVYILP